MSISAAAIPAAAITQAKLAANVAGNGPLFMAYQSVSQTLPAGTYTKLSFQTEEYDTHSAFSAGTVVTNGDLTNRFTPQIAGFYQVNGLFFMNGAGFERIVALYKNGVTYKYGADAASNYAVGVAALVYLNGSTDYIELFGYSSDSRGISVGTAFTYFQGYLVRAA